MQQARRAPDRDRTSPASRRQVRGSVLLIAILALASLLPFVDRAFRADDPLFVWAGDQIRNEPTDFYGVEVSWTNGRWVPMHEVVRNPPLTPYFIAIVRALFGEAEVALHMAFLLPALLALLGTRRLALEHGAPPTLAALATLFTPVFLVSATTVTNDVMLLAFWVWSMVWWERGLRTDHGPTLIAAGWLAGLTFLCGYVGLGVILLLLVVGLVRRRRPGRWTIPLLIPLGIAAGYETTLAELYDMADSMFAVTESRFRDLEQLGSAAGVGLVFVGGSLLGAAFWLQALWPRPVWVVALALLSAVGFFFRADAALLQQLVLGAVGVMILALVVSEARRRRDATSLILGLWILSAFAAAIWLNQVVDARSILPVAPALGILLARRVGEEASHRPLALAAHWPLVPAACVALVIAWADYAGADATRSLAREVVSSRAGPAAGRLWVRADGGLKYYLMRLGGQPFGRSNQALVPGDELVAEDEPWRRPALSDRLALQDPARAHGPTWLATLDAELGAGFFAASNARGQAPLPFALGRTSPRVLHRMRVVPDTPSRRDPRDEVAGSSPARHLLLISVDALRADHIGAYGSDLGITPTLDALAEQSQRFATCYATAPISLPSVASLLTGRYPDEIGMLDDLSVLPADTQTLATFLRANGFRTGAVVSNPVLASGTGLQAGFEHFDVAPRDRKPRAGERERIAPETTEAALTMLDALAETDARIFLWVHYRDPHGPYTPPAALRERTLARERARSDGQRALRVSPDRHGLGAIPSYQYLPPERTVAWYRAGYAGEVAYLDSAVAGLLAGLDERGLGESSLIVFTADHGESLGERDDWFGHGETLDESAVRVPLLFRAPGRSGSLRSELASLVDVLPTVASLLGLALEAPQSGFDLRDRLPGRSVYFTTGRGAARRRDGIAQVPYKLVRLRGTEEAREELVLSRLSDPERATTAARPGRLRSLLLQLNGRSSAARETVGRSVD